MDGNLCKKRLLNYEPDTRGLLILSFTITPLFSLNNVHFCYNVDYSQYPKTMKSYTLMQTRN